MINEMMISLLNQDWISDIIYVSLDLKYLYLAVGLGANSSGSGAGSWTMV